MGRPISVTDDQILEASERIATQFGTHGLTVSQVAREVGLSRAAITLRFAGAEALKQLMMDRMARRFQDQLDTLELEKGPVGLLAIATFLGNKLKGRENFSNFLLRYNLNIDDPVALAMEEKRGRALRSLIIGIMPETNIDPVAAVDAFMAHIIGSMLNWQTNNHPDAGVFLRERALLWIRLVGIPFDGGDR